MADVHELEREIGRPPGDPDLEMTPKITEKVRQWMILQGFDKGRMSVARSDLLYRAYTSPDQLRILRGRGDYYPAAAKACAPKPQPVHRETPPVPPPMINPPVPDLAATIAAALGPVLAAQQGGLTEYRVIEIIHEHVPSIVRQVLADIFSKE